MTFEIKVVLPAVLCFALQTMRCAGQGSIGIATSGGDRIEHVTFRGQCVVDTEDWRAEVEIPFRQTRSLAGLEMAVGHHKEYRLAVILDQISGEDGIVKLDAAVVVHCGHVRRREHSHHTRRRAYRRQIDIA